MNIPFIHYMLKEIVIKGCMAYDDKDFKETVDAFVAGWLLIGEALNRAYEYPRKIPRH